MSALLRFTTARRTSRANLVMGWLDGGTAKVYTANKPVHSDIAVTTQTLLVTFAIPSPPGTVTDGVFTGSAIVDAVVAATGEPTWARLADSSGVTIGDVDVGLIGSGEFIELDNLSLVAGGSVAANIFTLTEG